MCTESPVEANLTLIGLGSSSWKRVDLPGFLSSYRHSQGSGSCLHLGLLGIGGAQEEAKKWKEPHLGVPSDKAPGGRGSGLWYRGAAGAAAADALMRRTQSAAQPRSVWGATAGANFCHPGSQSCSEGLCVGGWRGPELRTPTPVK